MRACVFDVSPFSVCFRERVPHSRIFCSLGFVHDCRGAWAADLRRWILISECFKIASIRFFTHVVASNSDLRDEVPTLP